MAGKYSKLNKVQILEMFARWAENNPAPRTELEYTNTYTLLVAVALSAQATDVGVNKATRALWPVADTPQKMLDLGLEGLKDYIKTIGLYNSKAANVMKMADLLVKNHDGEVPRTAEELTALPGVGRKTADVVLNEAFHIPTIAVDTHIYRVSNRTGLAPGKTPDKVGDSLLKVVPEDFKLHAHHWLILHGRYICKARKPDCAKCNLSDICKYKDKTS
ncbi:endonuclease III [Temperatibacter marinus]|uniref:Endonuclease III n=1 Tax=Temperatibacter marinus TaxID=1456591 RepID=A0AA52H9N6_9PROT|nr:endonuclease III [Temperatibacter marinus]WND03381.1 endonuclease III [Temperatibacter marinus]